MGKDKPRHDPDKPQNRIGSWCSYCDELLGSGLTCEADGDADVCKGNPHNCVKTKYHRMASMSDKQKNEMRRKEESK